MRCAVHEDREATGTCTRCGRAFCSIDRRVQPRGHDLCRVCHLDPRARALPVEVRDRGWWRACASTLAQIVVHPNQSFRAVREPVDHGTVLKFLLSVRLPAWGVVVGALFVRWLSADPAAVTPIRVSIASELVGLQLAQVAAIWTLLLVPLSIPFTYFFAGVWAHVVMALTGGAHRTIGASLRANGYATSVLLLVIGGLEVPLILVDASPEAWAVVMAGAITVTWWLIAVALARTHGTSLIRGALVAVVPLFIHASFAIGAAAFELGHVPFADPPTLAHHPIP